MDLKGFKGRGLGHETDRFAGWNCYLSYVNSQGGAKVEGEEKRLEEKVEDKIRKSL